MASTILVKRIVWRKAAPISGVNPSVFRRDRYGRCMCWDEYGKTDSPYGWEIDHIKPIDKGGTNEISNLQPLQWENNRKKSNMWPEEPQKLYSLDFNDFLHMLQVAPQLSKMG